MGVDLGIKVLEIEFDLDVIVLIIADLLTEAILVLVFDFDTVVLLYKP